MVDCSRRRGWAERVLGPERRRREGARGPEECSRRSSFGAWISAEPACSAGDRTGHSHAGMCRTSEEKVEVKRKTRTGDLLSVSETWTVD